MEINSEGNDIEELKRLAQEFKEENKKFNGELLEALAGMKIKISKINILGVEISFAPSKGGNSHE